MRRLTASQLVAADATLRAASLGTVAVLAAAGRLTPLVYVLLLAVSSLLHAWGSAGTYTLIAEVLPEQDRVVGNALLSTFNQAAFILGAGPGRRADRADRPGLGHRRRRGELRRPGGRVLARGGPADNR